MKVLAMILFSAVLAVTILEEEKVITFSMVNRRTMEYLLVVATIQFSVVLAMTEFLRVMAIILLTVDRETMT
jgi:hypothetical protein